MYYMKYETTITSKGTITIAAPLRKALGLKPGQKVKLSLDEKKNQVIIDTGNSLEQFEAMRDKLIKGKIPKSKMGLSLRQLRDLATKKWLENEVRNKK